MNEDSESKKVRLKSVKILAAIVFSVLVVLGVLAAQVEAVPITFTGSGTGADGVALSASATFAISGNSLTITLVNTAPNNPGKDVPGNTLTGLFFDLTGNPTLTPFSATITAGSLVQANKCDVGPCNSSTTNVGGEFIYKAGSFPHGADRGIASSGYISGPAGNFNGPNLDDPVAPDGINFGIISNDPTFTPNGGLASEPLIRNSVVLALTGVNGLSESDISHVSFQYGTSFGEANLPGTPPPPSQVPEPVTLLLLGSGIAGLGLRRKVRKNFCNRHKKHTN